VVLVEQEDVGDDRASLETVMEASAEIMLHKAGDVRTDHPICVLASAKYVLPFVFLCFCVPFF
jgi:hypothetical protein